MAELKTKLNNASVDEFIKGLKDKRVEADCRTLLGVMKKATKAEPKMWGTSIIGFGTYHYKYASGREGAWFQMGFAPRKHNLTLYIPHVFDDPTSSRDSANTQPPNPASISGNWSLWISRY